MTCKHVGAEKPRKVDTQVQLTEHAPSYIVFHLHVKFPPPGMAFSIIIPGKVNERSEVGCLVAVTGLVQSLQEQACCKLGSGACFKLVAFGSLVASSTCQVS